MTDAAFLDLFKDPALDFDRGRVDKALKDWAAFSKMLPSFNLKELYVMYNIESTQLRRTSFLDRIRSRIKKLVGEAVDNHLLTLQDNLAPKGVTHGK